MSGPGPGAVPWGLALLLFAAAMLPLGELLRRLGAHFSRLLRLEHPAERALVDLYLGGGALYVVGSLPGGLYTPSTPAILLLLGAVGFVALSVAQRLGGLRLRDRPLSLGELSSPGLVLVGLATLGVYGIEVFAASSAATGNTFDSSVLTTFVGLLHLHHTLPTSYLPVANLGLSYPQGTTSWLAAAQDLFGLPPARTSLLVTPLFLSMAPVAAYLWGRRWFGRESYAVALGLLFALLASWTRVLVSGSNDFALAFPLVLLLWAWVPVWTTAALPRWGDTLAFGAVAGCSACLNPVGAELTFLLLPFLVLWEHRIRGGAFLAWGARWLAAVTVGLAFVLPSLWELAAHRFFPPAVTVGIPTAPASGLSVGQIIGLVDPLLFGNPGAWFSPFPVLRVELAVLLVFGLALLIVPDRSRPQGELPFGRFAVTALAVVAALLVLQSSGLAPALSGIGVSSVTSAAELSILLMAVYSAVAALPLARCLAALGPEPARPPSASRPASRRWREQFARAATPRATVALLVVLVILLPGVAVTATQLGPYLGQQYTSFSRVSSADFDLLAWAGAHLPSGAVVLVAPGSAAQFLPGYLPTAHLVYPMSALQENLTYRGIVADLSHGRFTAADEAELTALGVGYVAVTQNNSRLYAPFDPTPLLADPTEFPILFHEADAYLFGWAPSAPPSAGPSGSGPFGSPR